jgi:hypothetical protein
MHEDGSISRIVSSLRKTWLKENSHFSRDNIGKEELSGRLANRLDLEQAAPVVNLYLKLMLRRTLFPFPDEFLKRSPDHPDPAQVLDGKGLGMG